MGIVHFALGFGAWLYLLNLSFFPSVKEHPSGQAARVLSFCADALVFGP